MSETQTQLEGVERGNAVVVTDGFGSKYMMLYDEEFDVNYGNLAADTPVATVNAVLFMLSREFKRGLDLGERAKQKEIMRALGVDDAILEAVHRAQK